MDPGDSVSDTSVLVLRWKIFELLMSILWMFKDFLDGGRLMKEVKKNKLACSNLEPLGESN